MEPFIGSEALAAGRLNRHALRTRFQAAHPNIYLPRSGSPQLDERIIAAWLWSGRRGVIAGAAAAALHGTKWIDDDVPVELVHSNPRAPDGVITRRETLLGDEVQMLGELRVTVPARTAFDIGRRESLRSTVARLDALAGATKLDVNAVAELARRHPRMRGLRKLERALELVDPGAGSHRESYLRLFLAEGRLRPERTQIPVPAGDITYYLDMGWPEFLVAVEYDGEHHLRDRRQWRWDIIRLETLAQLGWIVIRVTAGDHPADILRRVCQALQERGYQPAFSVWPGR